MESSDVIVQQNNGHFLNNTTESKAVPNASPSLAFFLRLGEAMSSRRVR